MFGVLAKISGVVVVIVVVVVVVVVGLLLLVAGLFVVVCVVCKVFGPLPRPPPPLSRPSFSWTAQNFALFLLSPALIFILFLSPGGLLVELWPRFKAMAPKMRASFCETPVATLQAPQVGQIRFVSCR